MSVKGRELFTDKNLSVVISQREQSLIERIEGLGRQEMEEKTVEELCGEIEKEFRLEAPRLNEDEKEESATEVKVKSDTVGAVLLGGGEQADRIEHRINTPFDGDPELFFCKPSIGSGRAAPAAAVEGNNLSLFYVTTPGREGQYKSGYDKDLKAVKKYLKRIGREVSDYNDSIRDTILNKLDARRRIFSIGEPAPRTGKESAPEPSAPEESRVPDAKFGMWTFDPFPESGFSDDQESGPEAGSASDESAPEIGRPGPAEDKPAPCLPEVADGEPVIKYIVDLDLFSYSDISNYLEQSLGARAIQVLNKQIQGFVVQALKRVGERLEHLPIARTGDGAIIAFDSVTAAAGFAEAVHIVAEEHNEGKSLDVARRHFRVGVAKGEIILEGEYTPGGELKNYSMSGTAISKAVRLEASACTGEVLICVDTYEDLSEQMREQYGSSETIKGKRKEIFQAHRRKVVEPAPAEQSEG
jgi:class 3 adenylate cyclase